MYCNFSPFSKVVNVAREASYIFSFFTPNRIINTLPHSYFHSIPKLIYNGTYLYVKGLGSQIMFWWLRLILFSTSDSGSLFVSPALKRGKVRVTVIWISPVFNSYRTYHIMFLIHMGKHMQLLNLNMFIQFWFAKIFALDIVEHCNISP